MRAPRALDPFAADHRVLRTRLGVEECYERIRARTVSVLSPWTWFSPPSSRPLVGRVSRECFAVSKYTPLLGNSFRQEISGELRDTGSGTEVRVRVGMNRGVAVFLFGWLLFVGLMLLLFAVASAAALVGAPFLARVEGNPFFATLVTLGMFLFGCGMILVGRWISRGETAFVLGVLSDALDAREVNSAD